jgi:hypothetical protein
MQTIKLGSSGEDVEKWQAIIGVVTDGKFGPHTKAETEEWQKDHGLVADGIVGPATWAKAQGKVATVITHKTAAAETDGWAYQVMRAAMPKATEPEVQYALTVARGEGFYGKGWGNPSKKTIEESQAFGLTGFEGVGSNNWGAEMGKGSAGSFPHVDHDKQWKPYVGHYRRHATPEEGAASMAKVILGGGKRGLEGAKEIRNYINAGNLKKAVYAQYDNGYFELPPDKYYANVKQNYAVLTANVEWPKLLTRWFQPIVKILGMVT